MFWVHLPGRRALILGIAIALFGGLLLGAAFILSGIYNVAASVQHFEITNAIIRLTLRRSIATHSIGVEPPEDLSSEALARLGARHFVLGCAPCHASPGTSQNPVVAEMYPAPPPLSRAVQHWETDDLHWIVKHGLKFTGMPAWPALERDEEVWALVAFLERLPNMDAEEYAAMVDAEADTGASRLAFGPQADGQTMLAACGTCHGGPDTAPVHPLAPPLSGQKRPYLHRALTEYAQNRRQSGIMETVAGTLDSAAIDQLARLYSEAPAEPAVAQEALDPQLVRSGEEIAVGGVRDDDIPACRSCHAVTTSGEFPRLDGLPVEYIVTQLRLFREGVRDGSTYAAIMTPIARRLSNEQIESVAAYFASRSRATADTASSEARQ